MVRVRLDIDTEAEDKGPRPPREAEASLKEAGGGFRRKGAHTPAAAHTIFARNREPNKDISTVLD
jgi:hypothetical protein